ncbi:MAG: Vps62-related protein [Bdellovibrionia bacterium]
MALLLAGASGPVSTCLADANVRDPSVKYLQILSHPEMAWGARRSKKKQDKDPELPASDDRIRKELENLLKTYAPLVWLHSQEPYPPSDPLEFIEHSSLHYRGPSGRDQILSPAGRIEAEALAQLSKSGAVTRPYQSGFALNGSGYFLKLEDVRPATRAVAALEHVPMFWRLGEGEFAKTLMQEGARLGKKRIVIEYWYHTPYNLATRVGIGNHQGDWEGVAMLIELEDSRGTLEHRLLASFYAEHETGTWRCAGELSRASDGSHIEAFSAIGTHATYPEPGSHRSAVFTDKTERGTPWQSWENLRPLALEPYYGYSGAWGEPRFFSFMTGPLVPGPGYKSLPRETSASESLKTLTLLLSRCH